jgi:hypothetical protein
MGSKMPESRLSKIVNDLYEQATKTPIYDLQHDGRVTGPELKGVKVDSILARMISPGKFTCFVLYAETKTFKVVTNTRGYPKDFRTANAVRDFFAKYGQTNIHFEAWKH